MKNIAIINLTLGQPSFLPNSKRIAVIRIAAMANRGVITPRALAPSSYAVRVIVGTTAKPILEAITNSVPDNRWLVGTVTRLINTL
jgi:hypothetical protein